MNKNIEERILMSQKKEYYYGNVNTNRCAYGNAFYFVFKDDGTNALFTYDLTTRKKSRLAELPEDSSFCVTANKTGIYLYEYESGMNDVIQPPKQMARGGVVTIGVDVFHGKDEKAEIVVSTPDQGYKTAEANYENGAYSDETAKSQTPDETEPQEKSGLKIVRLNFDGTIVRQAELEGHYGNLYMYGANAYCVEYLSEEDASDPENPKKYANSRIVKIDMGSGQTAEVYLLKKAIIKDFCANDESAYCRATMYPYDDCNNIWFRIPFDGGELKILGAQKKTAFDLITCSAQSEAYAVPCYEISKYEANRAVKWLDSINDVFWCARGDLQNDDYLYYEPYNALTCEPLNNGEFHPMRFNKYDLVPDGVIDGIDEHPDIFYGILDRECDAAKILNDQQAANYDLCDYMGSARAYFDGKMYLGMGSARFYGINSRGKKFDWPMAGEDVNFAMKQFVVSDVRLITNTGIDLETGKLFNKAQTGVAYIQYAAPQPAFPCQKVSLDDDAQNSGAIVQYQTDAFNARIAEIKKRRAFPKASKSPEIKGNIMGKYFFKHAADIDRHIKTQHYAMNGGSHFDGYYDKHYYNIWRDGVLRRCSGDGYDVDALYDTHDVTGYAGFMNPMGIILYKYFKSNSEQEFNAMSNPLWINPEKDAFAKYKKGDKAPQYLGGDPNIFKPDVPYSPDGDDKYYGLKFRRLAFDGTPLNYIVKEGRYGCLCTYGVKAAYVEYTPFNYKAKDGKTYRANDSRVLVTDIINGETNEIAALKGCTVGSLWLGDGYLIAKCLLVPDMKSSVWLKIEGKSGEIQVLGFTIDEDDDKNEAIYVPSSQRFLKGLDKKIPWYLKETGIYPNSWFKNAHVIQVNALDVYNGIISLCRKEPEAESGVIIENMGWENYRADDRRLDSK